MPYDEVRYLRLISDLTRSESGSSGYPRNSKWWMDLLDFIEQFTNLCELELHVHITAECAADSEWECKKGTRPHRLTSFGQCLKWLANRKLKAMTVYFTGASLFGRITQPTCGIRFMARTQLRWVLGPASEDTDEDFMTQCGLRECLEVAHKLSVRVSLASKHPGRALHPSWSLRPWNFARTETGEPAESIFPVANAKGDLVGYRQLNPIDEELGYVALEDMEVA